MMARGFDSKFVEAQQEEASRPKVVRPTLTAAEQAAEAALRTLELSRARAAADLGRATNPAHRAMLEQAIAALDARLAEVRGAR